MAEKQTPIDLPRFLVRSLTTRGQTVLDLYGGVGTTSAAAIFEGRNVIYVDKDFGQFTSARARVTKLLDTEAAKAAFLNVQRGGESDEAAQEAAELYAKGAMVDRLKANEAAVDELLLRLDKRDTFATMSETWKETHQLLMPPDEVRAVVRTWFLSVEKPIFETFRSGTTGAAVTLVLKLNPRSLMTTPKTAGGGVASVGPSDGKEEPAQV